ncbi:amidase [Yunchengibacter salinarum]|uniref:amidase n=1 Tax=Yunchengibacter salinarum TaxID=3133399 RepID=UPI0035B5C177
MSSSSRLSPRLSRRDTLKALGAGAALAGGGALAGRATAEDAPLDGARECLPFAERLAGMDYTTSERAQMIDQLDDMVEGIRARRAAYQPDNDAAPARVFDPRLRGHALPDQPDGVRLAATPGPLPDDPADIAFAPVHALSHWIHSGVLTSVDLTRLYLDRIDRLAGKLQCFARLTRERALETATERDRELAAGRDRGPLHGIPYGLKDLADTAGIGTSWGATPYRDRVPDEDAAIVKRLDAAGAVMLGKTTLGALAYGDLWHDGLTRNPWAPEEGSSGSSAGSAAATAAGLVAFGIGTETMGSIVSPTTRCGAVGLKPSFGRVPRTGTMALCWSLDKIGPITRAVEDTALVLAALNGMDAGDPGSLDHPFGYDGTSDAPLRVGFHPDWFKDATDSDRAALAALENNPAISLHQVTLPDLPVETLFTILEVEAAAAFEDLTLSDQDDLLRWQEKRAWPNSFRLAHFHKAVELMQLDRMRRRLMTGMAQVMSGVDVLISPNFAANLLVISNFVGTPSLTLPVGFESRPLNALTGQGEAQEDGKQPEKRLPHTLTLWGGVMGENALLRASLAVERATGLKGARPSGFG